MRKILLASLLAFVFLQSFPFAVFAENQSDISQSEIMVGKTETLFDIGKDKVDLSLGVDANDVSIKDNFLRVAQKYILGIVGIVAISMFIYIGFQLSTAEGKQDQFTKAMKALVYLAVGLAVIPLAYIVIKITTGFTF